MKHGEDQQEFRGRAISILATALPKSTVKLIT